MAQKRLQEDFLGAYGERGDCFPNLLARSTYLSKYSRDNETWTDTIRRVVDGNCDIDPTVTLKERELLFHAFWTMQALPPGRGLWVGGIDRIPAEARYNCWYTTLYNYIDWAWVANMLMLGGGVGVGLSETSNLPTVSKTPAHLGILCRATHANVSEVNPDDPAIRIMSPIIKLEDSREGWVYGLERVLDCAFYGIDLLLDVSAIRPRGQFIKTFGGIACGPGPLVDMLRATWNIIRKAAGRKLSSVEALDITNHIGKCIKSGNVRRSALIALGQPNDQEFRDAKKDFEAVLSHRHTSNNSICFRQFKEFENFDWHRLVEDNLKYGEPGILNLALGRRTDPGAMGVNPCGEQLLHDREACNLAEVFPANFDGSVESELIFELVARYCLRQRLTPLTLDSRTDEVGRRNMRVGVGLGGICDFDWNEDLLRGWFKSVRRACDSYANDLGVARPITTTTVKPSGTISLLCGSNPGLHAPFAPYYIRRTRHAINDPMTQALKDAGVPWEMDKYDNKGNTICFTFPMKAKHTRVTTKTETVRDQFDRQLKIQEAWADNAVSCTINFNHDQPDELAGLLSEYAPKLKSTSCLPRAHGYEQAPYEEISQSLFEEMSKGINFNAKLTKGEFDSMEGCEASGACPIR